MYDYGFPYHMYGFSVFGFIFQIFFGILVIMLIIAIIRGIRRRHGWHDWYGDKSKEILKERYAKGELTKEQFDSMKKDLE